MSDQYSDRYEHANDDYNSHWYVNKDANGDCDPNNNGCSDSTTRSWDIFANTGGIWRWFDHGIVRSVTGSVMML